VTVNRNAENTLLAASTNVLVLRTKVATTIGRSELVLTETVLVATYVPFVKTVVFVKIDVPAIVPNPAALVIAVNALVVVTTLLVDTTVLEIAVQMVLVCAVARNKNSTPPVALVNGDELVMVVLPVGPKLRVVKVVTFVKVRDVPLVTTTAFDPNPLVFAIGTFVIFT